MTELSLTPLQMTVAGAPLDARLFLEGPAGTGKTQAGAARLRHLLARGVPAGRVLVLVPQRTLAGPYLAALRAPDLPAGGRPAVVTLGGLARRLVELFWPLAAGPAGFTHPEQPPLFLTAETAQFHLARLAAPALEAGRFAGVALAPGRLYGQILDGLNKAAAGGFPHTDIGRRLSEAWLGEPARRDAYAEAQAVAAAFRAYCLEHNLLDFSLQLEVWRDQLWPAPLVRQYLQRAYRHLIADNLEEDLTLTHALLAEWLPAFESALLISDQEAGYRRFLGAAPESAFTLRALCAEHLIFTEPIRPAPADLPVEALGQALAGALDQPGSALLNLPRLKTPPAAIQFASRRFYPEMLDWVTAEAARLIQAEGLPPDEIVILAPYLSDALRHALMDRLARAGVPARSHRPSRSLRDEPAARCLITLAALAHPAWGRVPSRLDVAEALGQAVAGLDPVRAQLLAGIVQRVRDGEVTLLPFGPIRADVQKRITVRAGGRYEDLRLWLEAYRAGAPLELDEFLTRLFNEVLVKPGYGFQAQPDAGAGAARLIESVRKFRAVADPGQPVGPDYLRLLEEGLLAAQSVEAWTEAGRPAVLVAPAYTFLLSNRPVYAQFWLDVGDSGWSARLTQPLTHPYVLSRAWEPGRRWTDADEFEAERTALYRLALGLLRRCRGRLYWAAAELGENGVEQRGVFLNTLARAFQRLGGRLTEGTLP